jgi:hypothetical protein
LPFARKDEEAADECKVFETFGVLVVDGCVGLTAAMIFSFLTGSLL